MLASRLATLSNHSRKSVANTTTNVGGSLTTDVTNYFDTQDANFKRRWQIEAIAGETKVRTLTVRVIPNVNDRRTNAQVDLVTIIRSP